MRNKSIFFVLVFCTVSPWSSATKAPLKLTCFNGVTIRLKAYLQGAILAQPNRATYGTLMRDDLRARKLIPPTDPYFDRTGFDHVPNPNNQSVVTTAVLSTTGNNAIVDWVFVELCDKTDPTLVLATQSGLIQRDGDVVSTDGVNWLTFPLTPDSYFVTLRHRNHLSVTTQNPVLIDATTGNVDFTDTATPVSGVASQVTLPNGSLALWAGDTNNDGELVAVGDDSDVNTISQQVLTAEGNTSYSLSYLLTAYDDSDTDLNGTVNLIGNQSDVFLISANVLNNPSNTSFSPSFVTNNLYQQAVRADAVAENILLYQRSNGGWRNGSGLSAYKARISQSLAKVIKSQKSQLDAYMDNGSTTNEIGYLINVFKKTKNKKYLTAAENGINYLLKAQYTNGGWPQSYPDLSSYHKHITYNDGTMIRVLTIIKFLAETTNGYEVVNTELIKKAKIALEKGIDCILKTQYKQGGNLTVWCAQHDSKTLLPAKARSYELPSLSGSESVNIVSFLMSINKPSTPIKKAIKTAVAWLNNNKIVGIAVKDVPDKTQPSGKDRVVVKDPNSTIWARFYNLKTNLPFFTGRDGVPKATLAEIPNERRVGYAFYGKWPATLLTKSYPNWVKKWDN